MIVKIKWEKLGIYELTNAFNSMRLISYHCLLINLNRTCSLDRNEMYTYCQNIIVNKNEQFPKEGMLLLSSSTNFENFPEIKNLSKFIDVLIDEMHNDYTGSIGVELFDVGLFGVDRLYEYIRIV